MFLVLAPITKWFFFALAVDSTNRTINSWTSQFTDWFTFTVISGNISCLNDIGVSFAKSSFSSSLLTVRRILADVSISFTFVGKCPRTESWADCANRHVLFSAYYWFDTTAIVRKFVFFRLKKKSSVGMCPVIHIFMEGKLTVVAVVAIVLL